MKRSAAPSHSKSSTAKKQKMSVSTEPVRKIQPATTKMTKAVKVPALSAKQLKAFHFLLSAASYISVLEDTQMGIGKIRDKCYQHYHGYDRDHIGVLRMFLEGTGRFKVLWDTGRIINGFGSLSGISHESIVNTVSKSTLKGKSLINGRQILDKAKAALNDAKKLLGFWMEFLINGQMPSGKNEEDALQHVLDRSYSEKSAEHDDDDDSIAGSDGGNTLETEIEGANEAEGDVEHSNERGTSDSESDCDIEKTAAVRSTTHGTEKGHETRAPANFFPPSMLLFIMYGPYGVAVFNLDLSAALNMDTKEIDDIALSKTMNTESMKKSKARENDNMR